MQREGCINMVTLTTKKCRYRLLKYCVYIETEVEFQHSNYKHNIIDRTYTDTLSKARRIYLTRINNEKHLKHGCIYNVDTLKKVKANV